MITLDIYSDPVCPWCYIGKSRLDAAMEMRPDHGFEISWHPFMLNPDMPPEGMDRRDYLEAKFGSHKNVADVYLPVQKAATDAGLPLDLAAIQRTPSTLDAHRLIHWAGLEGRQSAMVSALFRAYFSDGADIGAHAVLLALAESAGLDVQVVARLLESDADIEETRARDTDIRARGLRGVPAFVIAGQHVVAGAQEVPFWLRIIDELAAHR